MERDAARTDASAPIDARLIGFDAPPASRRPRALAVWACVGLGLLALVQLLDPPSRTLGWIAAFDAGHAPLFGAIALTLFQFLLATPLATRSRPLLYGCALGLAIVLGAATELLQLGADRDSDPGDVLRDALGACSFLLVAATRDPRARIRSRIGKAAPAIFRGAAAALLLIAFIPGALVARAYLERAAALPALLVFAGTWETRFVATEHVRLDFTTIPDASGGGIPAAHLRFEPFPFATFKLVEPYPDWTAYQRLRLVARSESDHPIELVLRIHDRRHNEDYADRFNRSLTFQPGINAFRIPLDEIRAAPAGREMDLSAIERLSVFAVAPEAQLSLYLLELRLE